MDDLFVQTTAGGIFAVLVIRMVFDFVGRWQGNRKKSGTSEEFPSWMDEVREWMRGDVATRERMRTQINDLHVWHAPDQDGEQAWKNKHITTIIDELKIAVQTNTSVLRELSDVIKTLRQRLGHGGGDE